MWPFKFPYTNFHELNLDWVLETVKSNRERISANELKIKLLGGDDPLNALHPIGSIFMSVRDDSPASLFGGTWEKLESRFLMGAGGGYALGSTGGEATHTLTVDEMPWHAHPYLDGGKYGAELGAATAPIWGPEYSTTPVTTGGTGGGQPHNNMPPYIAVNIWKRVS